jgi:hypothetical protein
MLITVSAIENETNQMNNDLLISLNASLQCAEIFLINTADMNPTWLKTIQTLLDDTTSEIMFREERGLMKKKGE